MSETVNIVQPSLPSSKIAVGRQPEGDSLAEPIHVLLVDDERLSRVVVGNLLRKCNYRGSFVFRPSKAVRQGTQQDSYSVCRHAVTAVATGVEALEALRSTGAGTFQLVLTVSHVGFALFWLGRGCVKAVFNRIVHFDRM